MVTVSNRTLASPSPQSTLFSRSRKTPLPPRAAMVGRVASGITLILWGFSDVLPESEPERGPTLLEPLAYLAQALSLVVGERVHGIEDQRAYSWTDSTSPKFLIQMNQDRVEERLSLAAPCSRSHDDIAASIDSLDCLFLVTV